VVWRSFWFSVRRRLAFCLLGPPLDLGPYGLSLFTDVSLSDVTGA
jgi:hypothetical protein